MKKKYVLVFLILSAFLVTGSLAAETADGRALLKSGLENFSKGNYDKALLDFREVVLNPSYEKYYDAAYYWMARSYMAQNDLKKAQTNLEFFIQNFPDSRFYPDAIYQKGRLLFMQKDYDNAIQALYSYIKQYPDKPFVPNSYFWIAEALFATGHFSDAQKLYSHIVAKYPSSYKVEAARYKISLIDLKMHEEELLRLLRLSHEEYLKAIDDFQIREKTYEQAIASYQRKLVAATNNDTKELVRELNSELSAKDDQIASLTRQLSELRKKIESAGSPAAADSSVQENQSETLSRLLELKNEALDLKQFYINWLEKRTGEK